MDVVWTVEWDDPKAKVKIFKGESSTDPNRSGYVTLDFKRRNWEFGHNAGGAVRPSRTQREIHPAYYEGHNWKKHLTEDAKGALARVLEELYPCT